jgi:hypothetical protein
MIELENFQRLENVFRAAGVLMFIAWTNPGEPRSVNRMARRVVPNVPGTGGKIRLFAPA